jgi:hypothetical protein
MPTLLVAVTAKPSRDPKQGKAARAAGAGPGAAFFRLTAVHLHPGCIRTSRLVRLEGAILLAGIAFAVPGYGRKNAMRSLIFPVAVLAIASTIPANAN